MTKLSMISMAFAITLFSAGCKKNSETTEGPMESAGEEMDQAGETTEEKTEEAVEEVQEETEEAGDTIEDATD
jgi:PBP1b-binding outer membrane lipoprotein LpoB